MFRAKKMRKILSTLVLGGLLVALVLPLAVSAQAGPNQCCRMHQDITINDKTYYQGDLVGPKGGTHLCALGEVPADNQVDDWSTVCIANTVTYATSWIFYILILVVVIMIAVGGFLYATARGDPDKATSGKNWIIYALVGLAVAAFARIIPFIVIRIIS